MPKTLTVSTGDGKLDPFVAIALTLPDAGGGSVTIEGNVQPVGGALTAVTGSPLTAPSIPGSGSTYWIIQVNTSTGAASVKQSNSAMPTADAGCIVVFSETLVSTDTSVANDGSTAMADQW